MHNVTALCVIEAFVVDTGEPVHHPDVARLEPSAGAALAEAKPHGLRVIVKEALANGRLTDRNAADDIAPLKRYALKRIEQRSMSWRLPLRCHNRGSMLCYRAR
jgi:hypothetical protein